MSMSDLWPADVWCSCVSGVYERKRATRGIYCCRCHTLPTRCYRSQLFELSMSRVDRRPYSSVQRLLKSESVNSKANASNLRRVCNAQYVERFSVARWVNWGIAYCLICKHFTFSSQNKHVIILKRHFSRQHLQTSVDVWRDRDLWKDRMQNWK